MVQTDNTRFQEFVYSVYKSMKSFEIFWFTKELLHMV